MNRRFFLQATAGAALGGLALTAARCADPSADEGTAAVDTLAGAAVARAPGSLDRIGVQLYTLRDRMKQDFAGTLEQVAEIGFDTVEFAGYFEQSPDQVRNQLDRLGLSAPAAHMPYERLRDDLERVIAEAQIIGHEYIVLPYLEASRRNTQGYRELAAFLSETAQDLGGEGVKFAYHNHDFEFETHDGRVAYDLLLEETDPTTVQMELDLYWAAKAGADVDAYFARYPGRFKLFHVKDLADPAGEQRMAPVGEGTLDFRHLLSAGQAQGGQYFFVEHDNPEDPLASIRKSYAYLSGLQLSS